MYYFIIYILISNFICYLYYDVLFIIILLFVLKKFKDCKNIAKIELKISIHPLPVFP